MPFRGLLAVASDNPWLLLLPLILQLMERTRVPCALVTTLDRHTTAELLERLGLRNYLTCTVTGAPRGPFVPSGCCLHMREFIPGSDSNMRSISAACLRL
jgi:hypothetical protein